MPERHQDCGGIAVTVAAVLAGGRHQLVDLALGQMLTRSGNCLVC